MAPQLDLKVKIRIQADSPFPPPFAHSAQQPGRDKKGTQEGVCPGKTSVPMLSWQLHHTCDLWQPESPAGGWLRA